jgi:hypothetical protein
MVSVMVTVRRKNLLSFAEIPTLISRDQSEMKEELKTSWYLMDGMLNPFEILLLSNELLDGNGLMRVENWG